MTSSTRWRIAGVTVSGRLSTLLTVPRDTPARRATSLMLLASAIAASPSTRGRPYWIDEHDDEIAWSVYPFDPVQLDIARCRWAADERQRARRIQAPHQLGNAAHDLPGVHD